MMTARVITTIYECLGLRSWSRGVMSLAGIRAGARISPSHDDRKGHHYYLGIARPAKPQYSPLRSSCLAQEYETYPLLLKIIDAYISSCYTLQEFKWNRQARGVNAALEKGIACASIYCRNHIF